MELLPLPDQAVEEANKPVNKGKHTDQFFSQAKQLKSVRSLESSLCIGQKDLRVSTAEIPLMSEVNSSTKQRGGHKAIVQRSFAPQEKSSENIQKSEPKKNLIPVQDWALLLKEKLSGCLSSYIARRWCIFEWFYSAIDYPWFSKREFMEYLNHVGLGDIPRLTRVEWSVIKSSLGKPRRFSECFLRGERQKLKQYRESVRKHYNELQAGTRDGLPTDLAKPLYVGQEVIALHSKTREIHDGSVDRVYHDMYRVQFDHPELEIKFVMSSQFGNLCFHKNPSHLHCNHCEATFIAADLYLSPKPTSWCLFIFFSSFTDCSHCLPLDIDCMPLNPLDNMPEALSCQIGAGSVPCMSKKAQMKGSSSVGRFMTCVSSGPEEKAPTSSKTLDKKEKLSTELGNQNSGIMENQNDADCFEDLEAFNKHDGTVSTALLHSRQRNTRMANALPPWMWPQTSFNVNGGLLSTLDGSLVQELGSTVTEIIKGSRLRAHTMVDAAFQALSSTKEGEDAFTKIGQVLDCVDYRQLATNSSLPVIRSQEQVNRSFDYHNRSSSYSSKPPPNVASGQKLHNDSDKVDTQIPMELITSCVATLIMIQTSTERQCPPADVAQILDYAVTSLHPCSPRNLPLYKEIQMCMGRIKTQILALAPT
ncbi:hypothetical protein VNO77_18365 [Canavalia gladiata]|uniref:DIRP domain-containing protein n=1 Tax=Canavalia gladiata TaxID=3824 RepID=A0AAN9LQM8_CANGL